MITDGYLNSSRILRGLKRGPFADHVHLYIDWLRQRGYSREVGHRYLSLARDFGFWLAATGSDLADVGKDLVTRYLAERSRHRPRYRRDMLALTRLSSALREAIAHIALKVAALAKLKPLQPHKSTRFEPDDQLFAFLDAL